MSEASNIIQAREDARPVVEAGIVSFITALIFAIVWVTVRDDPTLETLALFTSVSSVVAIGLSAALLAFWRYQVRNR